MMMHQVSALFYPVGLALIWRRSRERFWRDAALYTLISAGRNIGDLCHRVSAVIGA